MVKELTKSLLDDAVVSDGHTATIDLSETTLVDQIVDRLEVGVSPGNVGLDNTEQRKGGLVQLNEDSVVDLPQTEDLESLQQIT